MRHNQLVVFALLTFGTYFLPGATAGENLKLPKLLIDVFNTPTQVCRDARNLNFKKKQDKKFALVLFKSHYCDYGHNFCMSASQIMMDSCFSWVHENFHVYHTVNRAYYTKEDLEHGKATGKGTKSKMTPGSEKLLFETGYYGLPGPTLWLIDLEDCSQINKPDENGYGGVVINREGDRKQRFESIRKSLVAFEKVASKLENSGGPLMCSNTSEAAVPTFEQIRAAINKQYEAIYGQKIY